ncbi:MAG: hypothetical protein EOO96_14645 [Pedobacter sp.]|uniref:hypothetical protein n=1 Tax=Pedobacter agri TaxID=454586 RepID=UPI0012075D2E|nr:hypothetical protein [Pedobacter agri]RZL32187.1 MAG: hypothetical protein EOO96_14645 [Pedobacter sp.]
MKYAFLAFFLLIFDVSNAQKTDNTKMVFNVKGDLNKDGLADLVTMKEQLHHANKPLILEIKFNQNDGKYTTVLELETALKSKKSNQMDACILEELTIIKGVLIFRNQLMKGSMLHKFRYQNNHFELIGYTFNNADAGGVEFTDFNLITGNKIYKIISYETDKILVEKTTIEKINPLPNLDNFVPLDLMY